MADSRHGNFQSCCRLCLCEKMDTLKSVFDEAVEDRSLPQEILQFVAVEITQSDRLSTMVCKMCVMKVNNWHEYKKKCSMNQSKLEQMLNTWPTHGIADMSLQIKEEPMNEMDEPNHERQENEVVEVLVKSEPVDHGDEPMEEEYNELPPPLTPHPPHGTDSELSQEGSTSEPNVQEVRNEQTAAVQLSTPEQEKIQFAAGLKLLQKNSTPISCEPLSKIELSYIEKCKAMANMHRTLECACHNVAHPNLKGLLSHLRALRIWFPVFTCYNCMITFTDRSTFTRHNVRCPKSSLETLVKLSNLKKRSEVKTRLYQNFKCTSCRFMYSFHDDYCKHVDEDHASTEPVIKCTCGRVFDNLEDYKDHVYVSCLVEYYCDVCFVTTKTLENFQKHSQEVHDNSEGFILLQDDNYKMRRSLTGPTPTTHKHEVSDENVILTGKRERRMSVKAPILDIDEEDERPKKKIHPQILASGSRECPLCHKEYSSHNNMIRHYRTHLEVPPSKVHTETSDDDFYSCPECGGVYNFSEWEKHLEEKHEPKTCVECGKIFQFQTELDQHRSVHLNLKVYRDSKTQSYKTSMVSPGAEGEIMLMCEVCDVMFTTKEELKEHKLTHENGVAKIEPMDIEPGAENILDSKYACKPCNKVYSSYGGIWDHNKKKHPEKRTPYVDEFPKQCPLCDKVCTTGAAYYRHKQIHEKERISEDKAEVTAVKTPVPKIENDEEDESYHTCKRCFKVFSSKYNLKNHMKSHGITLSPKKIAKKMWCEVCHQSFNSAEALEEHKEEHNEEESTNSEGTAERVNGKVPFIFTCDVCVMTFTTKIALKKHKEKHALESKANAVKNNQVYCKYCKIAFDSIALLTRHMHVEHNESAKPKLSRDRSSRHYSCRICKKVFQTAAALSTHMGWHKRSPHTTGDGKPAKVLKQNQITAKFAKTLVKQEPVEPPEFQCTTCLTEFPNDTALQVHILEKHRSVSAIMLLPRCNVCNKDFETQDDYETHKRLHDFLERQKRHDMLMQESDTVDVKPNITHSKFAKAFPCSYCNAAFSRVDTLNGHMRQYHKEHVVNEFKCPQCDRIFDKQNSLSIHLKVHEKQKTSTVTTTTTTTSSKPLFSCSICNMGFDLPKDLRAHTISAHPF